eukprot:scaffold65940_cov68-Phaeocystis_antarctica.AAC.10
MRLARTEACQIGYCSARTRGSALWEGSIRNRSIDRMDTTPACHDTQSCQWIVARACFRCVRSRSTVHSIEASRSVRAGQTRRVMRGVVCDVHLEAWLAGHVALA